MDVNNKSSENPDLSDQVSQIVAGLKNKPDAYLIAITGIPGSGKSTLCNALASRLPNSAVLSMDGYHVPQSQLSEKDMKRRGAPHTFEYQLLRRDLKNLRRTHEGLFPAFDHARKDPEPGKIEVNPEHQQVFVEGNYLLLQNWGLEFLFDFTVFIDCDLATAMKRVTQRLYSCGICTTREEASHQVQTNDLLNAQIILDDNTSVRSELCVSQA